MPLREIHNSHCLLKAFIFLSHDMKVASRLRISISCALTLWRNKRSSTALQLKRKETPFEVMLPQS